MQRPPRSPFCRSRRAAYLQRTMRVPPPLAAAVTVAGGQARGDRSSLPSLPRRGEGEGGGTEGVVPLRRTSRVRAATKPDQVAAGQWAEVAARLRRGQVRRSGGSGTHRERPREAKRLRKGRMGSTDEASIRLPDDSASLRPGLRIATSSIVGLNEWGLFTDLAAPPGAFLGLFSGRRVDDDEVDELAEEERQQVREWAMDAGQGGSVCPWWPHAAGGSGGDGAAGREGREERARRHPMAYINEPPGQPLVSRANAFVQRGWYRAGGALYGAIGVYAGRGGLHAGDEVWMHYGGGYETHIGGARAGIGRARRACFRLASSRVWPKSWLGYWRRGAGCKMRCSWCATRALRRRTRRTARSGHGVRGCCSRGECSRRDRLRRGIGSSGASGGQRSGGAVGLCHNRRRRVRRPRLRAAQSRWSLGFGRDGGTVCRGSDGCSGC